MDELIIPLVASALTLVVTKIFDLILARRKEKADSIVESLGAVGVIASAAKETISYLKAERDGAREEAARLEKLVETYEKFYGPLPSLTDEEK